MDGSPEPIGGLSDFTADFDLRRRLRHARDRMLREVLLRHVAHHRTDAVDYRALRQVLGSVGIDNLAPDIGADPHLVDLDRFVRADAHIGHLSEVPLMAEVDRYA
jgi:hypothetical protein